MYVYTYIYNKYIYINMAPSRGCRLACNYNEHVWFPGWWAAAPPAPPCLPPAPRPRGPGQPPGSLGGPGVPSKTLKSKMVARLPSCA